MNTQPQSQYPPPSEDQASDQEPHEEGQGEYRPPIPPPEVPSGFKKLWRQTLEEISHSFEQPIQWSGWNQPALGPSDAVDQPASVLPTPAVFQVVKQVIPWQVMLNPDNVWGPAVSWEQPWEWIWENRFHEQGDTVPQNRRAHARPEMNILSWEERRDLFNPFANDPHGFLPKHHFEE